MIEPPDEPVLLEIVEYQIEGDIMDDNIRCHCLFHIIDTNTTFWIRNLDFMPDYRAKYWWSKGQGLLT